MMPNSALPPAVALRLPELAVPQPGAVVSRTLMKTAGGSVTLFAFDAGQGLSEHKTPFEALVSVLEGEADLTVGGQRVHARAGESVLFPADVPHAVHAPVPFKMLLTMLR